MPGLLDNVPVSDAQRRANDRHRPGVVIATLAVLCLYMYLFTQLADALELPRPQQLASALGIDLPHVFDEERKVESNVEILHTRRLDTPDDERLAFLLVVMGAFLAAYYLPLALKQASLVLWSLAALWLLYGLAVTAGLLMAHLLVYAVFHPAGKRGVWFSALAGFLAYWAFLSERDAGVLNLLWLPALPLLAASLYRYGILRLLEEPPAARVLRAGIIYSALLTICLALLSEAAEGPVWMLPLGLLLFFWQWPRLAMYHCDYQDGLVPPEVSIDKYLAVFFSPGVIPNWGWGVTIPQGYAYVNNRFLCRDKNRIVIAGLQLLGLALLYLVFWNFAYRWLVEFFTRQGVEVYWAYTPNMVREFVRGEDVSTTSVLLTTLLDLVRYIMFFAGVYHFKVGVWRICGYQVDPYYNRPWLATNLMTFWTRFAFHYREFLLRVFYYPVFFRYFRTHTNLRIFVASMAAAALGNLIWHASERAFTHGMEADSVLFTLGTWPYFFFLGLGIAVSQIYLLRRKSRRKPWTRDRWFLVDLVAAYLTLQYFALIHIFARPAPGSTVEDLFRLFFKGFGIALG